MRTRLKETRKAKGLTVADMAARLKVSRSFYYKIEAGIRNPTIDTAKEIADMLVSTVDELFFNPGWTIRPVTTKPPQLVKLLN